MPNPHLDDDGSRRFLNSAIVEQLSASLLAPATAIVETLDRLNCSLANVAPLTSGQLYLQAVWLRKGDIITSITFYSGTQAAVTPTNQVFSIYSSALALKAQTADDLTTAWGASAAKTLSFATPYTVSVTGIHYIGVSVAAATVPSLIGRATVTQVGNVVPLLSGTSTGSLTGTMPATAAAITGAVNAVYAILA